MKQTVICGQCHIKTTNCLTCVSDNNSTCYVAMYCISRAVSDYAKVSFTTEMTSPQKEEIS